MSLPYLSNWDAECRAMDVADQNSVVIDQAADAVWKSEAVLIAMRRLSVALMSKEVSGCLEDTFGDELIGAIETNGEVEIEGDAIHAALAEIDKRAAAMTLTRALATLAIAVAQVPA